MGNDLAGAGQTIATWGAVATGIKTAMVGAEFAAMAATGRESPARTRVFKLFSWSHLPFEKKFLYSMFTDATHRRGMLAGRYAIATAILGLTAWGLTKLKTTETAPKQ